MSEVHSRIAIRPRCGTKAAGASGWRCRKCSIGMLAPFAARLVEDGLSRRRGRVLDIGCGAGATTLAMARRLGPTGLCLGVDISGPLVAAAKARAAAEGWRRRPSFRRTRRPMVRAGRVRRGDLAHRRDVLRRSRGGVRQHPPRGTAQARSWRSWRGAALPRIRS